MPDAAALLRDAPWGPVLAALLVVWCTWRLNVIGSFYPYAFDKRGKRLPGPRNAWPFGFVWQIREWRKHNIWWIKSRELFQEHGPLIAFRVFSSYSLLVVDPEFVRQIVTGSADLFPKGHLYKQLGLVPGGLFTSNGPGWRRDRRILNPKFQFDAVRGYVQGFNRHTQAFVDAVRQRLILEPTRPRTPGRRADPRDGKSVVLDMVDAFSRLTLDIICDAGFGHALGSARRSAACVGENHQQMEPLLPHPEAEATAAAGKRKELDEGDQIALAVRLGFQEVAKRLTDPLRILKYLPSRWRRTAFARRVLRGVIEKAVVERAARGGGAGSGDGSLLDLMMEVHDKGTWTLDDLVAQSMTFLIAGHETTSALLAWTLLELGENPETYRKLRAEVDAVVGNDPQVEMRHVEEMPYLRALFKESLRLHPPVTVFSRRTVKDLQLGEYLIPAGWHVGVSVYCLHRHPALWERPDDFWPERWLEEQETSTPTTAAAAAATATPAAAAAPVAPVAAAGAQAAAAAVTTPPRPPHPNPQEVSPSPPKTKAARLPPLPAAGAARVASTVTPYEEPAGGFGAVAGGQYKGKGPLKSPFQFVPFSLGPRSCIGQRFALVEASVILARLVKDFDLECIDTRHTVTPCELLTVRPSRLLCRLTPRADVFATPVSPLSPPVAAAAAAAAAMEPGSPVRVRAPSP